jgi:hypothetical protein
MAVGVGKMVAQALACESGTKPPRGLKSTLQNRRGAQRSLGLLVQALACEAPPVKAGSGLRTDHGLALLGNPQRV